MQRKFSIIESVVALFAILFSLWTVFFNTPVENEMGIVQKIFYFHVPSAYVMYMAWITCTVYSILYIVKGREQFDMIARSSAEIALIFGLMVMTTGPLWGRKAWGAYWVWDPRLTSAMVLNLVILSYVILRGMGDSEVIKKFSGALSVVGAALIPLVHISVYKWRGQHPTVLRGGGLAPEMKLTLLICMISFTIVFIVYLKKRYQLEKMRRNEREMVRLSRINQINN
jgi:heme exporter protein C